MQTFHNRLADTQPQTCALRKAVRLIETLEDMFLVFIGYTRPGIFHEDGCVSGFFHAVSQRDTALRGKLPGIVDQVIHNLLQTYGIGNDIFACPFRKVGA